MGTDRDSYLDPEFRVPSGALREHLGSPAQFTRQETSWWATLREHASTQIGVSAVAEETTRSLPV